MQWARKKERERKKRETERRRKKRKTERKEKRSFAWCSGPALLQHVQIPEQLTSWLWAYSFSKHWLILCDWPCAGSWEYRHE